MTTTSETEPRDLTAERWQQFEAIEEAIELEWPDGAQFSGCTPRGAHHLDPEKYPGIPEDAWMRDEIYSTGTRRREWERQQQEQVEIPLTGSSPGDPGGPPKTESKRQPEKAGKRNLMMDWIRVLRDDARVVRDNALGMLALAVAARCDAFTGVLDSKCSVGTLSRDWGMSDRTVRNKLRKLETLGYLQRVDRGPRRASEYRLTFPESAVVESMGIRESAVASV